MHSPLVFILATRHTAYWKMKAVCLGGLSFLPPFRAFCWSALISLAACRFVSVRTPLRTWGSVHCWNGTYVAYLPWKAEACVKRALAAGCQCGRGRKGTIKEGGEALARGNSWTWGWERKRMGWVVPFAVPRCMGSKWEGWWDAMRSGGITTASLLNCWAAWQQLPWPSDELPSGTNQNVNKTPSVAKSISLDINQKSQQSIMCYWITIRIQL